jgi:eukaryotic-like serine/threonine-protein kinase
MADQLIADRYALLDVLGSGGAGAVWRGEDRLLGRPVAVKEVRIRAAGPTRARARVLREARAAARPHHQSVTAVYDVVDGEETVHIVMELVEGPSLADAVRDEGPLDPARAAELGLAVLAALEAAHARGVVHRDVKPGNVLLSPSGPKLTDFGIAAVDDDPSLTAAGTVLGSPAYMSPEQARGRGVGPASDLWALGATLHFAVEGAGPFDRGESLPTLAAVVGEDPAPAPHAGALGPVIAALLVKEPEERPSPVDLRERLADVVEGTAPDRTAVLPPMPPEPVRSPEPEAAPTAPAARPPAPAPDGDRRRRGAAVVVALVALGLLGGVLWQASGDDGEPVAEPPATEAEEDAPDVTAPEGAEPAEDDPVEPAGDAGGEDAADPAATATGTVEETEPAEDAGGGADADATGVATPAGFTRSVIGPVGASVAHPSGWQPVEVSSTILDHRDPGSSAYLRTDWTDTPAGDPVADWERQSAAFAQRAADYEEIRIEATEVAGRPGAIWEYRYTEGGAALRAVNVNIVDGDHAYALNVQTTEAAWDDLQPTLEAILASFSPGG